MRGDLASEQYNRHLGLMSHARAILQRIQRDLGGRNGGAYASIAGVSMLSKRAYKKRQDGRYKWRIEAHNFAENQSVRKVKSMSEFARQVLPVALESEMR